MGLQPIFHAVAHSSTPPPHAQSPLGNLPTSPEPHGPLVCGWAKQETEASFPAIGAMRPAHPTPTLHTQTCHSQTLLTALGPGGPRPGGAGPAGKASWGFYTGRKSKPRWGRKLREGGNDCNVSTQRQTRGRLAPPHPCHPVLTFVLRQNSQSGSKHPPQPGK